MEKIRQIWCEEDNRYYPEIKIENGRTYKLDEEIFVYLEQLDLGLTDEEQQLMENPVDRWGQEWRKFMTENYPEDIPSLQGRLKWELIPRQIDKEAWEESIHRMAMNAYEDQCTPANPRMPMVHDMEAILRLIYDYETQF